MFQAIHSNLQVSALTWVEKTTQLLESIIDDKNWLKSLRYQRKQSKILQSLLNIQHHNKQLGCHMPLIASTINKKLEMIKQNDSENFESHDSKKDKKEHHSSTNALCF